jgi:hypothetical protein
VKKLIARGVWVVALAAAAAMLAMLGATSAHAQSPLNKTYDEARSIVSDWGATPVAATITGDQLALDDCIVTSFSESSSVSALGENTGRKVLMNLNCNAKVAQPGEPGNSAMTPQGKSAKSDIRVANQINKSTDSCFKNDNIAYCKRVCERSGLCTDDALEALDGEGPAQS